MKIALALVAPPHSYAVEFTLPTAEHFMTMEQMIHDWAEQPVKDDPKGPIFGALGSLIEQLKHQGVSTEALGVDPKNPEVATAMTHVRVIKPGETPTCDTRYFCTLRVGQKPILEAMRRRAS